MAGVKCVWEAVEGSLSHIDHPALSTCVAPDAVLGTMDAGSKKKNPSSASLSGFILSPQELCSEGDAFYIPIIQKSVLRPEEICDLTKVREPVSGVGSTLYT